MQSTHRGQHALYSSAGTLRLTWEVILIAAQEHCAGRNLNVMDVCVSVGASKSTVLKLIQQLTGGQILSRRIKESDGRTQLLRLQDGFRQEFEAFLDGLAGSFKKNLIRPRAALRYGAISRTVLLPPPAIFSDRQATRPHR
ncbi:MAG: hypothetical protein VW268_00925 [Rhodospirillaceae bacterium]